MEVRYVANETKIRIECSKIRRSENKADEAKISEKEEVKIR